MAIMSFIVTEVKQGLTCFAQLHGIFLRAGVHRTSITICVVQGQFRSSVVLAQKLKNPLYHLPLYSLQHLDLSLCIQSSFSFQIQHYCFEVVKPDVSATTLKNCKNREGHFPAAMSGFKVHF